MIEKIDLNVINRDRLPMLILARKMNEIIEHINNSENNENIGSTVVENKISDTEMVDLTLVQQYDKNALKISHTTDINDTDVNTISDNNNDMSNIVEDEDKKVIVQETKKRRVVRKKWWSLKK